MNQIRVAKKNTQSSSEDAIEHPKRDINTAHHTEYAKKNISTNLHTQIKSAS
jgi:hypothetical protein